MNKLVRLLAVPTLSMKSRPIFKLLAVSVALFAITVFLVSLKAPRANAERESEHDLDESKIRDRF